MNLMLLKSTASFKAHLEGGWQQSEFGNFEVGGGVRAAAEVAMGPGTR
jgi:hypothetical protein